MSKQFIIQFGSSFWTGLAPTFSTFKVVPGGGSTTPPGITEIPSATGLYYFTYEPAAAIAFVIDGATSALTNLSRYIAGSLDPIQAVDERVTEMGSTLTAIGNTVAAINGFGLSMSALIGTTASSFGSTSTDPATIMGYLKRVLEFNEGNSIFTKSSGLWQIFARGTVIGASTQLTQKSITDSGSVITKA